MGKIDVYLIGLDEHASQVPGRKKKTETNAFISLLKETCDHYRIQAIAEEMSLEGLGNKAEQGSVCKQVSDELNLPHKYCDPDSVKRSELGIKEIDKIQFQKFYHGFTDEELQNKIRVEYEKRESFWLKEIKCLGMFPALFICGAKHSASFKKLLSQNGLSCKTLYERWKYMELKRNPKKP